MLLKIFLVLVSMMTITFLEFRLLIPLNKSLKECGMIKLVSKYSIYGWKWCNAPDPDMRKMLEL